MNRALPGQILWADLNPTVGHEQQGHRPVLVISEPTKGWAVVVPLTTHAPRGLTHHRMAGDKMSVAMCDQVRRIDLDRVTGTAGEASPADVQAVRKIVGRIIGI